MDTTLTLIPAYLVIGLGALHLLLTPVFYRKLTTAAMWYAGSGLALVLLAFVNIAYLRQGGEDSLVEMLCYFSNIAGVIFMGLLAYVYRRPQVLVGLVLLIIQAGVAFLV